MTNKEKFEAYRLLDKKADKILSILYRSKQFELNEYLAIADTLHNIKEHLLMEVLHDD